MNAKGQSLTLGGIAEFLSKLAENSENVYWLSSPDFQEIRYISPVYEKIWGRSRDILYKTPEIWITYLHPDDVQGYHPIHEMAERIVSRGPAARYSESYRIVRPDGETRWILDHGFPIYNKDGVCSGVTGVAIDITSQKKAEEALREAKEAAEAASQAKTMFLENMRHDIRTPLSGIVGVADIIKHEVKDKQIKEYVDNLVASSHTLLDFLEEVLDAVKILSGDMPSIKKKFSLQELLDKTVQLLKPKAIEKGLVIKGKVAKNLPKYFIGDSTRMQRILLELVSNALKFTEKGGVTIACEVAKKDKRDFVIRCTVSDTGIGIPLDKRNDIFVRFNRLSPSYKGVHKGAGLGLAIVKQFIDDIKGEIYCESELGDGTDFICLLPLEEALLSTSEGVSAIESSKGKVVRNEVINYTTKVVQPSNNKTKILVVEDNNIASMVAGATLTDLKCHVDIADSGMSALKLFDEHQYDLIFMDVGLPDISGIDVTKQIRTKEWEKDLHVPIVALTAHIDTENKQQCIEAGMDAVLSKPLKKNTAADIVNAFVPARRETESGDDAELEKQPQEESESASKDKFLVTGEVIDVRDSMERMGTSEEEAEGMIRILVKDFEEDLPKLTLAKEEGNWEVVKEIVHKHRGGSMYCGTPRFQQAALHLDECLVQGKEKAMEGLFQQFLAEMDKVAQTIKD